MDRFKIEQSGVIQIASFEELSAVIDYLLCDVDIGIHYYYVTDTVADVEIEASELIEIYEESKNMVDFSNL